MFLGLGSAQRSTFMYDYPATFGILANFGIFLYQGLLLRVVSGGDMSVLAIAERSRDANNVFTLFTLEC